MRIHKFHFNQKWEPGKNAALKVNYDYTFYFNFAFSFFQYHFQFLTVG